ILHHFALHSSIQATFYTQTSIHHLLLDESLCENYNTAAKINPPLVDKSSLAQILSLLQKGQVSTLTSLQCADFKSKKDQVFEMASFGIDALEIYFSLLYTYLHKANNIPLPLISQLTSYIPAQILNLNKGVLAEGKIAELIIINPNESFVFNDTFSPYDGQELYGKVEALFSLQTLHTSRI
ncbi:amidohydrolase family protein, partial [uncultured Helicobacter sp.]